MSGRIYRFDRGDAAARPASGLIDIAAIASVGGQEYREGYDDHAYRDLETRYLYREAVATVPAWTSRCPPDSKVGYVMGIGDEVPAALAQLGANVQLLGERELATGELVTVRRHHHRHPRVCGPAGSQDLQSPAAGLRPRAAAT